MNRKKLFLIIIVFCIGISVYRYYDDNYSSEGILEKVTNRDGYTLRQQEPVTVTLYIKPEWIPFNSDKKIEINEKLLELNGTHIILENVWNRGNDIYFSFHTTYDMNYKNGVFMYNGIFNEDGTFTTHNRLNDIVLYDESERRFDVAQTGLGPNSDFSFGIEPKNYKSIREGFSVEYNGLILYEYSKK